MGENTYITYNWLIYNVNLLKKRKYFAFNSYSFAKYATSSFLDYKLQIHASASKRNNPTISNSAK